MNIFITTLKCMNTIDKFCEKFANKIIWVSITIYILVFSYICGLKYYSYGYYDFDFASDVIVYWNSIHGKLLYYPFMDQVIFGCHLYLIIFLILPIYTLFQHPLTVLFLQSLFLGLAAYPLYILAKYKINKTFALGVSLAYLFYPSLGYINLFETHFDSFTIFFLFFALYYFEKEKFKKFLIFVFLTLSCKENVSLVIFMFGIYALLRKRSKKWILVPLILGAAWFFLALKLVIPYFAKDVKLYQEGFIYSIFYQHLGRNMFEMTKTILQHPIIVARFALRPRKILYLFQLFFPTGLVGIFSPAVLSMTLPIFMQNLLSLSETHAQIYYQYVAMLIPFIFSSVIFTFKKFLNYEKIYPKRNKLLIIFLIFPILGGFILKAPQFYFIRYIKVYQITDWAKEKERLVNMIPKDASVIATFQFLPHLAHRHNLYSMHFVSNGFKMHTNVKYEPPSNLEYALIDFNEPLMIGSFFSPRLRIISVLF